MSKKSESLKPVSLISYLEKSSIVAEQYRTIRSNILFSSTDKDIKTLVVTSPGASEGKSTSVANLSIVFADTGKKVLLVDADLRKPTAAISFQVPNAMGLSTLLSNKSALLEDNVIASEVANLTILPSGPKPPNPSEMLSSKRMSELVERMEENYDLIIFDLPPIVTVTDAQILAERADATLLVAKERKTNKKAYYKALDLLEMANANLIGVVLNGQKRNANAYYYYE